MSAKYVVKPKADRDLDDYADYLATEAGLNVASRFLEAAYVTFALIAAQPEVGWRFRLKYRRNQTIRIFPITGFEKMLALYRPLPEGVDVLRVLHGSRNIRALLRREGLE